MNRRREVAVELDAQKVQLETVLPARLTSAKARVESARLNAESAKNDLQALQSAVSLAKTTVERNRELLPTGAVSDIAVRQSENDLQAARARLAGRGRDHRHDRLPRCIPVDRHGSAAGGPAQ